MLASLHALLAGVFDYAGLFPPAELPLADVVKRFENHRAGDDSWMLSTMVLPVSQWPQAAVLATAAENSARSKRVPVALVGPPALPGTEWTSRLPAGLAQAAAARDDGRLAIRSLEWSLPADVAESSSPQSRLLHCIDQFHTLLTAHNLDDLTVFVELPRSNRDESLCGILVESLSRMSDKMGFKLRAGGLTAAHFPSPAEIARAIHACGSAGIKWKATAGLHHAFRGPQTKPAVIMHGFLNLLIAGLLAESPSVDSGTIEHIVADNDPSAFHFEESSLGWRSHRAGLDEIRAYRADRFRSIGSCSFSEPLDELRRLEVTEGNPEAHREGR